MGRVKEHYLQDRESHYLNLARALGITWEELAQLEFEVHANLSKDGMLYGYVIEFDENNNAELLNKINGLEKDLSVQLEPWALDRTDDEEYELSAINDNKEYKDSFMASIFTIERINELKIEDALLKTALVRQLFVGVIGAFETYLSDAFINKALSTERYLQKFVENHPEFKKEKINLCDIFSVSRQIEEKAKSIMVNTIYHKLPIVKGMYESTFDITFPDISEMQKYITQRHDLVHRNGKTIDGKNLLIDDEKLKALIATAVEFVCELSGLIVEDEIPF